MPTGSALTASWLLRSCKTRLQDGEEAGDGGDDVQGDWPVSRECAYKVLKSELRVGK